MRKFTVVLTADLESGGYTATIPALPGCVSDGETIDDALRQIQDAIALYLQDEEELNSIDSAVGPQVVVAEVMVA
jgi:predicted RNase H-like HicB family nuclease